MTGRAIFEIFSGKALNNTSPPYNRRNDKTPIFSILPFTFPIFVFTSPFAPPRHSRAMAPEAQALNDATLTQA